MSRLAGRRRGDLFIEGKNNLLIWLMDQNLKIHPQRSCLLAFLLTGASSKIKGRLFAAGRAGLGEATSPKVAVPPTAVTQGMLCGAWPWIIPHIHTLAYQRVYIKQEHDVWFPQGLANSCLSSCPVSAALKIGR